MDSSPFVHVFNMLDHNNDFYVTFDDLRIVLPHLTVQFTDEIIRTAIDTIVTDRHDGHLSYFDFIAGLKAIRHCQLTMPSETHVEQFARVMSLVTIGK
jgi:Ca2+-binding EF-hand superfamily protein